MNIESLARQAVNRIKETWGLPTTGFLAGGSIANIIWELASGNKAVVNDIDIFHFDGIKQNLDKNDKSSLFNYKNKETKYFEDYTGLCFSTRTKEFYSIVSAERDGMFNNIKYKSNTEDPSLIIRSFDINSTRVGYHIDEDKIYWTKEFEDFLQTGELKVCNLFTPSHTSVRIAKKSKELNAKLEPFEFNLLQYGLSRGFSDKIKWRFKEKYQKMFDEYSNILEKFFKITRDIETENYVLSEHGEKVELFFLEPITESLSLRNQSQEIFDDSNLNSIYSTTDFLFYMRNVYGSEKLSSLWPKLHWFFVSENYVDMDVEKEDIELLHRFSSYAPDTIENLKGLKLSEQIKIIKTFLEKYKEDPIVAISILEKVKVDVDMVLDEETLLLMELSVRKKIVNDTRNKVGRILGHTSSFNNSTFDDILL